MERGPLTDDELDQALEAIGDFCDLRCPFFAGHARATADLVRGAAELMQMPAADVRLAYRAALVHDVGRFGVPGSVWGKPGPLTANEQERVRLHVYYVERIFSRPDPLRRIGLLAATHHERMDSSGYHRGVGGTMLSSGARVLAVADAYSAMMQPRPYREPLSEAEAVRELRADAAGGRLDPVATDAVLAAAGHRVSRTRAGGPAGLTTRENDVLGSSRPGDAQQGHRPRVGDQPEDGEQPRRARLQQAGCVEPDRRGDVRHGVRDRGFPPRPGGLTQATRSSRRPMSASRSSGRTQRTWAPKCRSITHVASVRRRKGPPLPQARRSPGSDQSWRVATAVIAALYSWAARRSLANGSRMANSSLSSPGTRLS